MQIRIVTYNIKSGRYQPHGLEAVARTIQSLSPDILALQEVDEDMRRTSGVAQTDWLSRRLRMTALFAPAMAYDGGQYGIALLSRYPISTHQSRRLYQPVYPDAASRPRHDSEPRVMLGVRLLLPDTRPQGGLPLSVVVAHLGLTQDQRLLQLRELSDFSLPWASSGPLVVLGDFNCEPDAPELAPLRASLVDACAAQGVAGDARITFPLDSEPAAIDYIWVSPTMHIISAKVVHDETQASDHFPLVVDVEL